MNLAMKETAGHEPGRYDALQKGLEEIRTKISEGKERVSLLIPNLEAYLKNKKSSSRVNDFYNKLIEEAQVLRKTEAAENIRNGSFIPLDSQFDKIIDNLGNAQSAETAAHLDYAGYMIGLGDALEGDIRNLEAQLKQGSTLELPDEAVLRDFQQKSQLVSDYWESVRKALAGIDAGVL